VIKVTKLEATDRLLAAAIRKFFAQSDPLAVHCLVASVHQVLCDLAAKEGAGGVFRNESAVPHEVWREWRDATVRAENFLKHADRDPLGELEFHSGQTDGMLLDSCALHQGLTQRVIPEVFIYEIWAMSAYPHWFHLSDTSTQATKLIDSADLETVNQLLALKYDWLAEIASKRLPRSYLYKREPDVNQQNGS